MLKAPVDAVVAARHPEAGTVVRAGDPIFTLMDPSTVWVLVYVDEASAGPLALGQEATIRLCSLPRQTFTGTVARIGVESDRVNEGRRAWLTCADRPAPPTLGEHAEAHVSVAIARAPTNAPRIILADEPAAARDSARSGIVTGPLRKLAVELDACIIAVTHDEKIFDRFDRLYRLRDGRFEDGA